MESLITSEKLTFACGMQKLPVSVLLPWKENPVNE